MSTLKTTREQKQAIFLFPVWHEKIFLGLKVDWKTNVTLEFYLRAEALCFSKNLIERFHLSLISSDFLILKFGNMLFLGPFWRLSIC